VTPMCLWLQEIFGIKWIVKGLKTFDLRRVVGMMKRSTRSGVGRYVKLEEWIPLQLTGDGMK